MMGKKTIGQTYGEIGEDIAAKFLVKRGFRVIMRNYRKKYGEIDIICKKQYKLHFVEVKTVSRETSCDPGGDWYRPEDNVHAQKLKRLGRAIQAYLAEFNIEDDWQFDVITVLLDHEQKTAKVRMLPDIIL